MEAVLGGTPLVPPASAVTKLFRRSAYVLAAYTGFVLAWADGNFLPTGLTVVIALAALYLNEERGILTLRGWWINLCGVLAFVPPVYQFYARELEGPLIAGVHLLVYLQWVLVFQEKSPAQFWWILAITVLQMALAAVLTTAAAFGIYLVFYVLGAIWTLTLFSLSAGPQAASDDWSSPRHALRPERSGSRFQSGVQSDPEANRVQLRFLFGVIGMTVAAIMLGFAIFLAIPRMQFGYDAGFSGLTSGARNTRTGFTDRVQLGDMGEILESTRPVMRVRFIDTRTDKPLSQAQITEQFGEEPLFRGSVLIGYKQGRWNPPNEMLRPVPQAAPRQHGIRQEYELQAIGTRTLFAVGPVWAGRMFGGNGYLEEQAGTHALTSSSSRGGTVRYEVLSFLDRSAAPSPFPSGNRLRVRMREWTGEFPRDDLPRLAALAEELTDPQRRPVPPGQSESEHKARLLESYLRDSGQFTYSLNLDVADSSVDPLEDFLFNRKSGHCEYFASALAMMLRAVGVRSRVVTGFKGALPVSPAGTYEVQQRHAHAWVEALIDGRWTTFDGTPAAARLAFVEEVGAGLPWWVAIQSSIGSFWLNYVVNMNAAKQQQEFYYPLEEAVQELGEAWPESPGQWAGWLQMLLKHASQREWWTSLGGLLTLLLALGLGLSLSQGASLLISLARRRLGLARTGDRHRDAGRTSIRVPFYERWEALLARRGLNRPAPETPLEFAGAAQTALSPELGEISDRLVRAYYRIRYGGEALPAAEERDLNRDLDRLAAAPPDAPLQTPA